MKRKRIRASGGVTALLAALTAAIYLLGMAAATVCTAAVLCSVFDDDTRSHLERIFLRDDDWTDKERTQYALCRLVYDGSSSHVTLSAVGGLDSDRREPLRQIGLSGRRATVVFDADGKIAVESGDFLYFPYLSAASWDAGADESVSESYAGYAYVPLAREHMHPNLLGVWEAFTWPFSYAAFRVTGQRDGAAFRAARVEAVDEHAFEVALDTLVAPETVWQPDGVTETRQFVVSDIVRRGNLTWQTIYEDESVPESETVYATRMDACAYDAGKSVTEQGVEYDSLLDLARSLGRPLVREYGLIYSGSLVRRLRVAPHYLYEGETLRYVVVTATEYFPLRSAMALLRNWYIALGLLSLILFALVRSRLRRRLTDPLALAADAADGRPLGPEEAWRGAYPDVAAVLNSMDDSAGRIRSLRDENGRLTRSLGFAEQAERSRRELTSHLAHELKTPLAIVSSYAEGLSEHIEGDRRDEYLAVIRGEAARMDGLVRQMLDLSRLEAGRVVLRREEFSLTGLARDILPRFERPAGARKLRLDLTADGSAIVNADRARVEQVLENLISNAVTYASEGTAIRIAVSAARRGARFAIENDCPPLPDGALGKLFEPFYRADESRSSGGTGLGLAICKSVAELHGGSLRAEAIPGGLRFVLAL